jgi:hypothetical protein
MPAHHMLDQLDRGTYGPLSMKARSAAGLALTLSCGQLRHRIDAIAKPNATIQVIPSATVIRTMLGYPITLLCFRVHEVPDVAYIEQLTSALYVHEHQQVSGYGQVLDGLALEALQPAESADYPSRLLCDF